MGRASNHNRPADAPSFGGVFGQRRGRGRPGDELFAAAITGDVAAAHAWLTADIEHADSDVGVVAQHLASERFERDYTDAGLAFNYMAAQKVRDLTDPRAVLYRDERSAAAQRERLRGRAVGVVGTILLAHPASRLPDGAQTLAAALDHELRCVHAMEIGDFVRPNMGAVRKLIADTDLAEVIAAMKRRLVADGVQQRSAMEKEDRDLGPADTMFLAPLIRERVTDVASSPQIWLEVLEAYDPDMGHKQRARLRGLYLELVMAQIAGDHPNADATLGGTPPGQNQ